MLTRNLPIAGLLNSDLLSMVPVQWNEAALAKGPLATVPIQEERTAPPIVLIKRADLVLPRRPRIPRSAAANQAVALHGRRPPDQTARTAGWSRLNGHPDMCACQTLSGSKNVPIGLDLKSGDVRHKVAGSFPIAEIVALQFEEIARGIAVVAATLQGWGGPDLLATCQQERRPVHQRVIDEATVNYATLGNQLVLPMLEAGRSGRRCGTPAGR